MAPVHRVTLFKITDPGFIPQVVEKLSHFKEETVKDGKPYLLRYSAGPTVSESRNHGYNFCIQSTFASLDDMKYYDETCSSHKRLKALMQGRLAGPPLTVFQDDFVGDN